MDLKSVPIIRLEIENLKHSISHYLGIENSDLEKVVHQEIDKQKDFLDQQVRLEVSRCINQIIREKVYEYFSTGEGADNIKKAIKKTLDKK